MKERDRYLKIVEWSEQFLYKNVQEITFELRQSPLMTK